MGTVSAAAQFFLECILIKFGKVEMDICGEIDRIGGRDAPLGALERERLPHFVRAADGAVELLAGALEAL